MRINNIQADCQNINKKNISYKGGREVLRTISNPDSLASLVLLESFVTGGRSAKAYKRGGFPEFRERFTDDVVSAVFWMKGVDIFNKLGDKLGEKVLNLPTTDFDVGKDALRTPFQNLVSDSGLKADNTQAAKKLEKKLAAFKFTKIITSSLLAIGFVGFVMPKINQTITQKIMKNKKNTNKSSQNNSDSTMYKTMKNCSFEEFEKIIKKNENQSFKGAPTQIMTTAAHYLENNKFCKLLTSDVGILTGRVTTARNKDEGIEYLFRDTSSSFFYYASTPLIYKLLQKVTGSINITDIDPVCAKQLNNVLTEQLKNADGNYISMGVKDFTAKTIGVLNNESKELLSKLPFNSDVISLKELSKYVTDEKILKKASEMAMLQPEQAGIGKVLTKQQVEDVFKNGSINSPEFMQKIYKSKFGEALTNSYKFIPMKKITKFRDNINKYTQSVIDTAVKKNNGTIDKKLLDNINKKSFTMSAGFRAVALGISAIALGAVIPTLQYAITAKRTGKNQAPGLREYDENSQKN